MVLLVPVDFPFKLRYRVNKSETSAALIMFIEKFYWTRRDKSCYVGNLKLNLIFFK